MLVYRICRAPFKAIDGEGARLYGGRWNSPGRSVLYTSSTLSLAALEYLVHVDPATVPSDLIALTISVPDGLDEQTVDLSALPSNWAEVAGAPACQQIGDDWVKTANAPLFRVPAAPTPEESNVLINLKHPAANGIFVRTERHFAFDPRLIA